MTPFRTRVARFAAALVVIGAGAAADGAPPVRKGGTVHVELHGARDASGTFPATCGSYFMQDVRGVAKAGDGLVFETDVAGVGHLQVNSTKRIPGRAAEAGLILNTTGASGASYVGDARPPNKIVFGPKLDTASVRAKVTSLRGRRGSAPDAITIEAEFDCSK